MALTNRQKQRRYRDRMYSHGMGQQIVWVRRNEPKRTGKIGRAEFAERFRNLTKNGFNEEELSQLYRLLLKITRGKKEEIKLKKR